MAGTIFNGILFHLLLECLLILNPTYSEAESFLICFHCQVFFLLSTSLAFGVQIPRQQPENSSKALELPNSHTQHKYFLNQKIFKV